MTQEKQTASVFRSPYEMYFENGNINPAGDLLAAGVVWPTKRNDWQDTRGLWSYPYYNFGIMLGEGQASFRNENEFTCNLSHGNFFLTFPDVKQQYAPGLGESWGEIYISFTGAIFDALRAHQVITPEKPVWRLNNPQLWIERLQAFLQKPVPSSPSDKLKRASYFLSYLLEMLAEGTPVQSCQPDIDWFGHACNLLTKDLHHEVDLHDIADDLGMSYNTFRNYFKRRAGVSPMLYRDQARLKAACHYLAEAPVKPCSDIAFIVGYSNAQRFSQQFKNHIGMTPLEYRKNHRKA